MTVSPFCLMRALLYCAVLYGLNEDNLRAFEHINEFAEFHEGNSFFFTLPVKDDVSS